MKQEHCVEISIDPSLKLYHTGPPLDTGSLPTVFYFALSGPDSLCTDPFNQPVRFLSDFPIRVFSLTLPAHENNLSPHDALNVWAEEMRQGKDPLQTFLEEAQRAIEYTIHQKLADPKRIALAGLSRGGLLASLLSAKMNGIDTVLGFAPLVKLSLAQEFQSQQNDPLVSSYDLTRYTKELATKKIRFYIGNRDLRVSTKACFATLQEIVEKSFEQKIRSPQIELTMSPSIGHKGHGTSPEIFKQGALWLADHLHLTTLT